jgi:hypothetical protein
MLISIVQIWTGLDWFLCTFCKWQKGWQSQYTNQSTGPSPQHSDEVLGLVTLQFGGYRKCFPLGGWKSWGKKLITHLHHNTQVKTEWRYASTPLCAFWRYTVTTLPLTFYALYALTSHWSVPVGPSSKVVPMWKSYSTDFESCRSHPWVIIIRCLATVSEWKG